jgi:hypothetical protein
MQQNGTMVDERSLRGFQGVSVRPAASRDELESAYRLVYSSYRQRGYVEENSAGVRLTLHNALPGTVTFVCVLRGEVIATVSMVPDSAVQLPMDSIYHAELQELRDAGRKPAEVTMLADRREDPVRALPMLKELMKRVFDYATLVEDTTDLCIAVNPRHERYYRQHLLFTPFGEPKSYPSVRGHPAVAERLDLKTVAQRCKENEELRKQFLTNRTPLEVFRGRYQMTLEDLEYFFSDLTPLFKGAPDDVVACLKEFYPEYPWDYWQLGGTRGELSCA